MMDHSEHKMVQLGGLEFVCMHRTVGEDGGASIEVYGDVDGKPRQVLRFDCFSKDPHFHYAPGGPGEVQLHLDQKLTPDSIGWAMKQIQKNVPEMLVIAGFSQLAEQVDRAALFGGWTEVKDALVSTVPAPV